MRSRWSDSNCFVGISFQDLFKTNVEFPSSLFPMCFESVHGMHPYSSMDTAWKKSSFILSDRLDLHIIRSLFITVHALTRCMLKLLSVDVILLPRYVNRSSNFRGLPLKVDMHLSCLKHMNSVLLAFTQRLMPPVAYNRNPTWADIFSKSVSSAA